MQPTELESHPEGGAFKRTFTSDISIAHPEKGKRAAISHIYFSLESGEVSLMHRVTSDEVWNLYKGEGVFLYLWDGTDSPVELIEISAKANAYCHVVPAGTWQAAVPISTPILVGCSVAPAFDFSDFTLLKDTDTEQELFLKSNPGYKSLINTD